MRKIKISLLLFVNILIPLVHFRWIIPLVLLAANFVVGQQKNLKDKNFFNGKNLKGWSASSMQYWSVQDGAITGKATEFVIKNEFIWSEIEVKDFYLSLDVKLIYDDRNAGIQFRSVKTDEFGQAKGYQADVGKGWWGKLYHEHDRGLLDSTTNGEKAIKPGQWNHYEILAVGNKIWTAINGTISSAIDDPTGEKSGYIALQIHSGPFQTVQYRIKKLIHNPDIKLAGLNEAGLEKKLRKPLVERTEKVQFKENDVVIFCGGTNIANMRKDGYLETMLQVKEAGKKVYFRNIAMDGDLVYEQYRQEGFSDWKRNIDSLKPKTIFVNFGQIESLKGENSIPDFIQSYKKLLDGIKKPERQVILISPAPFEPQQLNDKGLPKPANLIEKDVLEKYTEAIEKFAREEGYVFIDLMKYKNDFKAVAPYTYNGVHLSEQGQKVLAQIVLKELNLDQAYNEQLEPIRAEVIRKNELWLKYWDPVNWAFLWGNRSNVAFSFDVDYQRKILADEINALKPMIEQSEQKITDAAKKVKIH